MFWNREKSENNTPVDGSVVLSAQDVSIIEAITNQLLSGDFSDDSVDNYRSSLSFVTKLQKARKYVTTLEIDVDVNSKVLTKSSQELLTTSQEIRESVSSLTVSTNDIEQSSEEMTDNFMTVTSATKELHSNMQLISDSTISTQNNLLSISESTGELTFAAQEIASSTEQATTISKKALLQVEDTTQKVARLEKAGEEINKVTTTISEISDQTKLLALNATIEAARAGEAGKGFAVVAKEVKDLAQQTSIATKDIQSRISIMQGATTTAIEAISSIYSVISEVNDVVTTIAAASEEQSVTTSGISHSIKDTIDHLEEITTRVAQGASAVEDVNRSMADASKLSSLVDSSIKELNLDSHHVQQLTLKNFSQALEIDSHSNEAGLLVSNLKVPSSRLPELQITEDLFCHFTSAFDLGVKRFDDEHKVIFRYINDIHKLAKMNSSLDNIIRVIKELAEFTTKHFAHEETIFQEIGWSNSREHTDVHQKLLATVTDVIHKAEAGENIDLMEILIFLKKWLFTHILKEDMQYTDSMIEHGIQ